MSKKDTTVTETKETVVTETEPVVVTEKKLKKPAIVNSGPVMYVGPTIEHVVQHSTVFRNGALPAPLIKLIEEAPYVKKLIVPVEALPAAMRELNQKDSALCVISEKVKNIRR